MKKIFTFLAASALVVLAASCAKEQQIAAVPAGEETTVEFTVATPELMTKAIADGSTVDKVSCSVYGADGLIADLSKTIDMTGGKATFSVRLVTGQTYSFLFWAYDKDGSAYTLDADAKTVAVDYAGASNDESRDAFYAYIKDKKITSSVTETVTLKRPFAQVNFGVEPEDIAAAKTAGYEPAKSSVKLTGLANVLNLTDGTVSGTVDAEFTVAAFPAETFTVNKKDYNYVATNYVLVGADKKQLSDVELKIYDATSTEPINTISVPNVPLQGNYRTNILGNLFTSKATFNIIVDPDFNGEEVLLVADEDKLEEIFEEGGSAKLAADIELSSSLAVPSGKEVALDLNGHAITVASGIVFKANGGTLTIKNGTIGSDDVEVYKGIYSDNASSSVVLENVTFGNKVTYAFNGNGKLEAKNCKFHGWMSGWFEGGTFTNCEFNIGKAYYPAAICYGNTTFTSCKFFNNGVSADGYQGPESDGFYRCNYVVALSNPATSISFVTCKFIDADNNETDVTAANHPYHGANCSEGWGDGTAAASATVTVDGAAVTLEQ